MLFSSLLPSLISFLHSSLNKHVIHSSSVFETLIGAWNKKETIVDLPPEISN